MHKGNQRNLENFVACKTKAASLLDLFKQVDTFLNSKGKDEMLFLGIRLELLLASRAGNHFLCFTI